MFITVDLRKKHGSVLSTQRGKRNDQRLHTTVDQHMVRRNNQGPRTQAKRIHHQESDTSSADGPLGLHGQETDWNYWRQDIQTKERKRENTMGRRSQQRESGHESRNKAHRQKK